MSFSELLDTALKIIALVTVCVKALSTIIQWLKANVPHTGWMSFSNIVLRNWGMLTAMLLWAATVLVVRLHPYNIDWFTLIALGILIVPPHERGVALLKQRSPMLVRNLLFHVLRVFLWYVLALVVPSTVIYLAYPTIENQQAMLTLPDQLSKLLIPMVEWAILAGAATPLIWFSMHNNIDTFALQFRKRRLDFHQNPGEN